MSYAYNYSYLQNDIIYNLHMSSVNSYVSGVYQPLRDLIIDRHNSNSNYSSRITKVEERSYKMYLEYIGESSNYPSLFSLQASISNAESYFNEISQHYSSTQPSFDHFFPIAVRYTDNKNIWLIERPPFLANITYKNSRSNSLGKETNYSIWMPWTVMLLVTNPKASDYSASLFFNDGPITSLDDKAIPCFFPNMYSNGRMCLNQTSVMLQQHLAQVNSFDPATIYNFIINDYMSGGWNSDLGIQAFDRLLMFSETAKNARNVIVNGNYADKKNYPPSTTPSGRLSDKKYIPNFLNYFSKSTLEEITAMVSEAKNISSNRYYSTYSSLISEATSSSFSSHSFSQIFESNSSTAPIYVKYNIYLDPSVDSCLTNISYDSPATFFEESLGSALLNQVKQDLFSEISILSSNPKHSYYHLLTPDLYVDFEDNNFKTFTLDPSLHDQSYFVSKFNTLNNQVQTI